MKLKRDAKFKEKLTCSFKHDIRNLVNFHPTNQKSENFTSMGSFCPKYKGLRQKIQRNYLSWQWTVMGNLNKPWLCGFKTGIRNWWTFIKALKNLKICTLMGSFQLFMFQLENSREIMCHDTERWCKV